MVENFTQLGQRKMLERYPTDACGQNLIRIQRSFAHLSTCIITYVVVVWTTTCSIKTLQCNILLSFKGVESTKASNQTLDNYFDGCSKHRHTCKPFDNQYEYFFSHSESKQKLNLAMTSKITFTVNAIPATRSSSSSPQEQRR